MNSARRILDLAVSASVTVVLLSCGEATEQVDQPDDGEQTSPIAGKADSFEELETLDRDGECDESDAKNDPDCQLRVASWNIQNLGKSKAKNDEVMEQIVEKMEHFDLVAVQEVTNVREMNDPNCPRNDECPEEDSCGTVREAIDSRLNDEEDDNYGLTFSPQVRHERYLYVYDKDRVQLLSSRLVHDPGDSTPVCAWQPESTGAMDRQPFLGVFQADDFSFAMLNVHVSPDEANEEIDALMDFEDRVSEEGYSDVIIAGDLNADCRYLTEQQQDEFAAGERYHWLFRGADTAVAEDAECGYDQMLVTEPTLEDLTGELGVAGPLDEEVSDHYPIWADFYTHRDSDEHDVEALTE